jgi:hypothetical protein
MQAAQLALISSSSSNGASLRGGSSIPTLRALMGLKHSGRGARDGDTEVGG